MNTSRADLRDRCKQLRLQAAESERKLDVETERYLDILNDRVEVSLHDIRERLKKLEALSLEADGIRIAARIDEHEERCHGRPGKPLHHDLWGGCETWCKQPKISYGLSGWALGGPRGIANVTHCPYCGVKVES